MENAMEDNLDKDTKVQSELKGDLPPYLKGVPRSYLKGGLISVASIIVLGGGFLTIKGPSLVKGMAQSSLERTLAPLGIKQIEIETVNIGWGRFYFRDIRSKDRTFSSQFKYSGNGCCYISLFESESG